MSDRLPPYVPVLPLRAIGGAVYDATGRIVAVGSDRLCQLVAAGHPVITRQGSLFDGK